MQPSPLDMLPALLALDRAETAGSAQALARMALPESMAFERGRESHGSRRALCSTSRSRQACEPALRQAGLQTLPPLTTRGGGGNERFTALAASATERGRA